MSVQNVDVFAQQRSAEEYLYLLLDPLAQCPADHPLQPAALRSALGDGAVTHVPRPDLVHDSALCPVLVQLAGPGEAAPDALLESTAVHADSDAHYSKRLVCGWLTSSLALDAVASHVADMCAFVDGAQPTFIPVFEPVRLELLAASDMASAQRRLGPIREWLLPASSGGNPMLLSAGRGVADAAVKPIVLEVQREAPSVTALLSAWRDALQSDLPAAVWAWRGDSVLPPNAATEGFRHIRQARSLGLRSTDDIVVLALHRLMLHPRLHEHPMIAERIGRAARGDCLLSDLFAPITDAQWTEVVRALMDPRKTIQ